MNLSDQRKLEITNEALLEHAHRLEESVAYWREETDKAWETAKRWKADEEAKAAGASEENEKLCTMIAEIGARIQLVGGGNMERHPCDAILYQIKEMLPAGEPAPVSALANIMMSHGASEPRTKP